MQAWFHTALSRGSGRIENACGGSPAAPQHLLIFVMTLGKVDEERCIEIIEELGPAAQLSELNQKKREKREDPSLFPPP